MTYHFRLDGHVAIVTGVLGVQDPGFRQKFCDRVPLGRMAENDDLTGPLIFLASDVSSYVTGTELRVDGGYTAW